MKKFTKILSLAMAIAMTLSVSTITSFAANKERTLTLSSSATTVAAGESITVSVVLDTMDNLNKVGYFLTYNTDVFSIDTTITSDDIEACLDVDWYYDELTYNRGVWGKNMNVSLDVSTVPGQIQFTSMHSTGGSIAASAAKENFTIGKFIIDVNENAKSGTYAINLVNATTLDAGEVIASPVNFEPLQITVEGIEEEEVKPVGATWVEPQVGTEYQNCGFLATLAYDAAKAGVRFNVASTLLGKTGTKDVPFTALTNVENAESITVGLNITNVDLDETNETLTATAELY